MLSEVLGVPGEFDSPDFVVPLLGFNEYHIRGLPEIAVLINALASVRVGFYGAFDFIAPAGYCGHGFAMLVFAGWGYDCPVRYVAVGAHRYQILEPSSM